MKKSKLIEIISTFSLEEMKSFEKFISSPYFSRGRDVSGFFSQIKKIYPDFQSPKLNKEILFKELFPDEKYNQKKLKNLSFELTYLAEQFLISESLKKNESDKELMLAIQYKDRGKRKLFANTLNIIEERVNGNLFDSFNGYSLEDKLLWLKQEYAVEVNDFRQFVALRSQHNDYIFISFLVKYLRALRDREVLMSTYSGETNNILLDTLSSGIDMDKILEALKKQNYPYLWLIEMYYYLFKSSRDLDDEPYNTFRQIYKENSTKFSKREKYYLLNDFLSFCIRKYNLGNYDYRKEEMELYKEMIKEDALKASDDEFLSIILYRNILFLSTDMQEENWYFENMDLLLDKLQPDLRENTKYYSIAHIEFMNKNFEKALENIIKVKYDVFLYKLDVKNMLLKIYLELNMYEQAFSLIDTYKHFLKNNKEISKQYKSQFVNFISIYIKILRIKSRINSTKNIEFLFKELNDIKTIASRDWLFEKISEMKVKYKAYTK